jgi:hypothetical protein
MLAKETGTEAVKGADPGAMAGRKAFDPAAHLVGSFIGEGEGEDLPSGDPRLDQMGNPMGDYAGFSAAGAGQDEKWSFDVENRLTLGVGQACEE